MSRSADVKVDMELMRRIEALPVTRGGTPRLDPTPAQVTAVRKYWKSGRRQTDIAKMLGVHHNTVRRWYREYVEGGEK